MTCTPAADGSVLLTADDFGLCREVNEAVCELYDRGVLQSASLIANMEAFDLSVAQLWARPGLRVGVHLNLTDGRPVLPTREVPSLVNADGEFLGGRHYRVLAGILAGHFAEDEVRAEWTAQLARVEAAGIAISHLNSHGHFHLVPAFRGIVLDLMERFSIPYLRLLLSVDSVRHLPFAYWSRGLRAEMERRHLTAAYPGRVYGLACQGAMREALLLDRLGAAGEGLAELIVHPSAGANEYHRRWRYEGEGETRALLSADVATLLRRRARSVLPDAASA